MRFLLGCALACVTSAPVLAQVGTTVRREKGHFAAAFAYGDEASPRFPLLPATSSLFEDAWGLMRSARLAVDWWTLFGEPVEDYYFRWESSDRFTVPGGATITRAMLAKYPDLTLRFEQLAPTGIEAFVFYQVEQTSGRRDCELVPRAASCFVSAARRVQDQLMGEPAGITPMHAPGSPSWDKFLSDGIERASGLSGLLAGLRQYGPAASSAEAMLRFHKATIIPLYNTGTSIGFHGAVITQLRWPQGEMRAIADLHGKYERGELDPPPSKVIDDAQRVPVTRRATTDGDVPWEPPEVNLRMVVDSGRTWRVGYRDAGGRLVVPFTHEQRIATPFDGGVAIAGAKYGEVGLLDGRGQWVIPPDKRNIRRIDRDRFAVEFLVQDDRGRPDTETRVFDRRGRQVLVEAFGALAEVFPTVRGFASYPKDRNGTVLVLLPPGGPHVAVRHGNFRLAEGDSTRVVGRDFVSADELGLPNLICNLYEAGGTSGDIKWSVDRITVYDATGKRVESYTEATIKGKEPRKPVRRSAQACLSEYRATYDRIESRLRAEGHRIRRASYYGV